MAEVVGGLRTRFIFDSVYNGINDGLDALGWFDPGRAHRPVTFTPEPVGYDEEVELNSVAMTEGSMFDREAELGSNLSEAEYNFFIDVYAENATIGRALANDIRDLIKGRHGGRTHPAFTIYDYRTSTPSDIGYVTVENVTVFREPAPSKSWQQNWYSVRMDVIDYYG